MNEPNLPMLGAAYYPEDWDEKEQEHDIAWMKKAGLNVVRIGEFAWRKMEPQEGQYDFAWLHRVVNKLAEAGICVVLGTPSATPPIWLEEKDPFMFMVDHAGLRRQHGGRRNCCSNNPTYINYSLKIAEKMAQEFGDDPNVIGWQIDNEISIYGTCYCDHCVRAFREHLQARYGTIENLNQAWNLNLFSQAYDSFEQVPAPQPNVWHNPHIKYEWITFHTQSHARFIHKQAEVLHRYTKMPVGTDMMPIFTQDYEEMNEPLDVVQFNHYETEESLSERIFWYDYLRTMKDRPFWVTETSTCWNDSTKAGGSIRAEGFCRANSWLPIVLGGEANMYWLWRQHWAGHELMHGSVLYASGRPMHIFHEVQEIAEGYAKAADFLSSTKITTDFAIMVSSKVHHLMNEQPVVEENHPNPAGWYYPLRLYRLHKAILETGIRPDILNPGKSLTSYKVLFTPFMLTLELGDLQERIQKWVQEGGTWIAGPMTDIRNSIGAHYTDRETGILEKLTGAALVHQVPDTQHRIPCSWADGNEFRAENWLQLFDAPEDAQILATVDGYYSALAGKALIFQKNVGKGSIIVLGTEPSREDYIRLLNMVLSDSRQPKIEGTVAAAYREGNGLCGISVQEYGGKEGKLHLDGSYTDLLTGRQHADEICLAPYQTAILRKDI